jgi:hypothetical protein
MTMCKVGMWVLAANVYSYILSRVLTRRPLGQAEAERLQTGVDLP